MQPLQVQRARAITLVALCGISIIVLVKQHGVGVDGADFTGYHILHKVPAICKVSGNVETKWLPDILNHAVLLIICRGGIVRMHIVVANHWELFVNSHVS